jgi:hypothetical protein
MSFFDENGALAQSIFDPPYLIHHQLTISVKLVGFSHLSSRGLTFDIWVGKRNIFGYYYVGIPTHNVIGLPQLWPKSS